MTVYDYFRLKKQQGVVLVRVAEKRAGRARGARGSAYHRHSAVHYACLPPRPPPPPRCPSRRGRTKFATLRIEAYSPQTLHEFVYVFLNKLKGSWNRNYKFALSSAVSCTISKARPSGPPRALPRTTKLDSSFILLTSQKINLLVPKPSSKCSISE